MRRKLVFYTSGSYKYRIATEPHIVMTPITGFEYEDHYIKLEKSGRLTMKIGYAWNGASGPTIDTKSSIAPSGEHDAFYQLLSMKVIPMTFRKTVDEFFHQRLKECGMWSWRAWLWWRAVHRAGGPAARSTSDLKVHSAPAGGR